MAFNYTRYRKRLIFTNADSRYSEQISKRNRRYISQFGTPQFRVPTDSELINLTTERVVWKVGSRFYKLAHTHYGDPSFWWIIAWFNQKPLETDFKNGDVVLIPTPLEMVLNIFEARGA